MSFLSQLQKLIATFNWHTPSWDLFILLFWIVAGVLYAFAAGRGRILTVLISIYMAKLLVTEAPFLSDVLTSKVAINTGSLQQLVVFGVLFLLFFIFLGRYAFRSSADGHKVTSLGFSLVFAILQTGLLVNIVLTYLPEHVRTGFSPLIQFMFLHPYAGFIWLALPVVYLIVLGRFISERAEL